MKNTIFLFGSLAIAIMAAGCSDNAASSDTDPNASLYAQVLDNDANDVIVQTYQLLNVRAMGLEIAIDALAANKTEENLAAVKVAWQGTREPWEQSESFLYGPIETEEIVDPAIDSWPVDVNAINTIINTPGAITATSLATNNDSRGFHTIEYLIWGIDSNKTADQITPREIEFLQAAIEDVQFNTQKLYDAWNSTGGNYAANFSNAGNSGSVYPSQKAALTEMAQGLLGIADEVANGKIEEPLNGNGGTAAPEREESRFSHNSTLDFANNIRSIQNMYLGDYLGHEGKGLTDVVVLSNPALDTAIKTKIQDAIDAINAIPGTFSDAIVNNRPAVVNAQQKVNDLRNLLQTQLIPLVSNL
jgi:predicted lipoprotein